MLGLCGFGLNLDAVKSATFRHRDCGHRVVQILTLAQQRFHQGRRSTFSDVEMKPAANRGGIARRNVQNFDRYIERFREPDRHCLGRKFGIQRQQWIFMCDDWRDC